MSHSLTDRKVGSGMTAVVSEMAIKYGKGGRQVIVSRPVVLRAALFASN